MIEVKKNIHPLNNSVTEYILSQKRGFASSFGREWENEKYKTVLFEGEESMNNSGFFGKTVGNAKIELNAEFVRALELMEKPGKNVFVTGKAGTGKSTLLDYFRKTTRKKIAVLAPTGVAAVNVQGQTIHSFFGFKPDITLMKVKKIHDSDLYKELDAIVIDEVSMVRADLLDCMDKFLRLNGSHPKKPFGGLQMLFFGDLYQLAPVVTSQEKKAFAGEYKTEYFFDAHCFENLDPEFVELEKIYRQKDQRFIELLNSIRNNTVTEQQLKELNRRVQPGFEPKTSDFFIYLTTLNKMAGQKNETELEKLKTKMATFAGKMKGEFDAKYLPCEPVLKLKAGAQVMLVNNDSAGRWVNGTVGKIIGIDKPKKGNDIVIVQLPNGENVGVEPHTWNIFELAYNPISRALESRTIGSFTQYPVKLAWAITIHKSQGKTFEKTVIDIGNGTFSHGQTYVALSRCTSLDGIVLKKPIQKKHVLMDWKIVQFLTKYQYALSDKKMPLQEKTRLLEQAAKNKTPIEITYLKNSDQKSKRTIQPTFVGQLDYQGKKFLGVDAYCFSRQDNRVFRIDRILEIGKPKEDYAHN